MSTVGLFAMGVLMTLVVGSALALLIYAAVLDGRDEARRKEQEARRPQPSRAVRGTRTAA